MGFSGWGVAISHLSPGHPLPAVAPKPRLAGPEHASTFLQTLRSLLSWGSRGHKDGALPAPHPGVPLASRSAPPGASTHTLLSNGAEERSLQPRVVNVRTSWTFGDSYPLRKEQRAQKGKVITQIRQQGQPNPLFQSEWMRSPVYHPHHPCPAPGPVFCKCSLAYKPL